MYCIDSKWMSIWIHYYDCPRLFFWFAGWLRSLFWRRFACSFAHCFYRFLFHYLSRFGNFPLAFESFHNLLFLYKESTNDTLTQAPVAQYTTIRSGNSLLPFGQAGTLTRSRRSNALQLFLTLATFRNTLVLLYILIYQTTTRSTNNAPPVGLGVVGKAPSQSQSLDHFATQDSQRNN